MLRQLMNLLSPEERSVVGEEARQLLENKHYRQAWSALDDYITAQEEACDPDHKEKAQRLVITRQLLRALHREFERKVQDGEVARVEIAEIERARRPLRFMR